MPVESPEPETRTVHAWDLPTRMFHGMQVLLAGAAALVWWTGSLGDV
jgi:hypothetical protein